MIHTGYVYILLCKNGRYYIGSTDNVERRLLDHQAGKAAATKNLRPLTLVFSQQFDTLTLARQMEAKLKKMKSREVVERILKEGEMKLKIKHGPLA